MWALRPGLKSSRQAQMTERGAIGYIGLPSLRAGVRAERPLNRSKNGYAIVAERERQPWDLERLPTGCVLFGPIGLIRANPVCFCESSKAFL